MPPAAVEWRVAVFEFTSPLQVQSRVMALGSRLSTQKEKMRRMIPWSDLDCVTVEGEIWAGVAGNVPRETLQVA